MAFYETIFIARQDLSPSQVESLIEKFSTILQNNGGSVEKTEYIGLRTFESLIKKYHKGHYALLNLTAEPAALKEFERLMRLNEDIIRFMTVKVEEHEKGSSALLKASRYQRDDYEQNTGSRQEGDQRQDRYERSERSERHAYRPMVSSSRADIEAEDAPQSSSHNDSSSESEK